MKKFTYNDIFYNTLLASPKYVVVMQSGSLRINDQINQNQEYSSSLNGIEYGGTYSYSGYTGSLSYTSSISRSFIYAPSQIWNYQYTQYSNVTKISAIKNSLADYKRENNFADIKYYLLNDGIPSTTTNPKLVLDLSVSSDRRDYFIRPSCSINLLEIPRDFYGNYIKPGSVQLNMYVSGVLTASAIDSQNNGKLIQTYGGTTGSVVGSVLYDHGLILLTGSDSLSSQQAPYIQPLSVYTASASPVNDYLKWIYFGSYSSTTSSAPETKYELIFQGANFIPTVTMMCHAEKNELYWSNNNTFIENSQGDEIFNGQSTSSTDLTGSTYYADDGSILVSSLSVIKESKIITIKNTISSSFTHYSASYEPQVFISQIGIYDEEKNLIGIAKLANPVRKTKDLDYTFKLKLDF
jgi:hypothetical protein